MLSKDPFQNEEIYRLLIEEASILAALYTGPDIRIRIVNKLMLHAWNKDESIIGKPMREANPELEGQPFFDYFDKVYKTGIEHVSVEERAVLTVNGIPQTFYFNFSYKPLKYPDGTTWGIVHTAMDVTEQVHAKMALKRSEEMLRLAVDSADMGTWFIDSETRQLTSSARTKNLFGYNAGDNISLESALNQIPKNHRERVVTALNNTLSKGQAYYIEFPVTGYRDKVLRSLRAKGRLYEAEGTLSAPVLAGTILDITVEKEIEQRKDDFISIASHELKTPITSLKASLQLINRKKNNISAELLSRFIRQANKSMLKINSLVDDLLNVSCMNAGQLHINKSSFTLAEMINSCCHHIRDEGSYELVLKGDTDLVIYADEHRIEQVVVNFVNNAVKYSPLSYKINLAIERTGNDVRVSVSDQGPGISPEKIPYLFNRYYRADKNGNQYSGLGLGLYISAEIIKRHGGKIGVESELGKGSTFWFTIPIGDGIV